MPALLAVAPRESYPLIQGYMLLDALLAAGAPPQKVVVADKLFPSAVTRMEWGDPAVAFLPQELVPLPGPKVILWLPSWALGALRYGGAGCRQGPERVLRARVRWGGVGWGGGFFSEK